MNYNQRAGKFGESLAKDYLIRRGYRIIGLNLKIGCKEVDIIARDRETLVFVEVKTRLSSQYGLAEDAFEGRKFQHLKAALEFYVYKNNCDADLVRLDLVAIDVDKFKKIAKISHYKDII